MRSAKITYRIAQIFSGTVLVLLYALPLSAADKSTIGGPAEFYSLEAKRIDGSKDVLSRYKGQVVLVVNTASRCGFTPQYRELQELYTTYKDRGFAVLAFPSNDFDAQEPGTNRDIRRFCSENFGVTFPLFEKTSVTGKDKHAVFRYLTEQGRENLRGEINWNFEKFLIGRDGRLRERFSSFTNPMSTRVRTEVEELLKEKRAE